MPDTSTIYAEFNRAMAATPGQAERAAMYAWVLGWISAEDPDLVLRALREWRQVAGSA